MVPRPALLQRETHLQLLQPPLRLLLVLDGLPDDIGEGFSELFAPGRKLVGVGSDAPYVSAAYLHLFRLCADTRKPQKADRELGAASVRRLEVVGERWRRRRDEEAGGCIRQQMADALWELAEKYGVGLWYEYRRVGMWVNQYDVFCGVVVGGVRLDQLHCRAVDERVEEMLRD